MGGTGDGGCKRRALFGRHIGERQGKPTDVGHTCPPARGGGMSHPRRGRAEREKSPALNRDAAHAAAPTRSRRPVTPMASAQCSQQKKVPSLSSPWPTMRMPQFSQVGASAWIAHSKLSKVWVVPFMLT